MIFDSKIEKEIRESMLKSAVKAIDEEVIDVFMGINKPGSGGDIKDITTTTCSLVNTVNVKDIEITALHLEISELKKQSNHQQRAFMFLKKAHAVLKEREVALVCQCFTLEHENGELFQRLAAMELDQQPEAPKSKQKLIGIVKEALRARKMSDGEVNNLLSMLLKPE